MSSRCWLVKYHDSDALPPNSKVTVVKNGTPSLGSNARTTSASSSSAFGRVFASSRNSFRNSFRHDSSRSRLAGNNQVFPPGLALSRNLTCSSVSLRKIGPVCISSESSRLSTSSCSSLRNAEELSRELYSPSGGEV